MGSVISFLTEKKGTKQKQSWAGRGRCLISTEKPTLLKKSHIPHKLYQALTEREQC